MALQIKWQKLCDEVEIPTKAHPTDAGMDMRVLVKKSGDFQREILANVTHDLKTPLTMIKAYASMIKEISGDNPEKRDMHLQVIIDETDRLTGLVNDVLSVSKVNSNLGNLNPKVFNLTEYLYGDEKNVVSIYPAGADVSSYELSAKQKEEYHRACT